MKTLILIQLLFISIVCHSQSFEELKDGNDTYFQYIALFDSTSSKKTVYSNILINTKKLFKSNLIFSDYGDSETGNIILNVKSNQLKYHDYYDKNGGYFTFYLKVVCKDGKAKLTINEINYNSGEMVQMKSGTNFSLDEPDNWTKSFIWNKQSKKEWGKMKNQFRDEINTILKDLIKVDKTLSDDF